MSENYPYEGHDCPECGNSLLAGRIEIKENKKTGHLFYGCSNWPHCKWVQDSKDVDEDEEFMAEYEMPKADANEEAVQ